MSLTLVGHVYWPTATTPGRRPCSPAEAGVGVRPHRQPDLRPAGALEGLAWDAAACGGDHG